MPVIEVDELRRTLEQRAPVRFSGWIRTAGVHDGFAGLNAPGTTLVQFRRTGKWRLRVPTVPSPKCSRTRAAAAPASCQVAPAGGESGATLRRRRRRSRFVTSSTPADVDWAILNARTVAQMSDVNVGTSGRREDIMAENVARILDQAPPGSKLVLWAHNLRLAPGESLGARLANRYGQEMVVLGFAFHEGRYSALVEGTFPGPTT